MTTGRMANDRRPKGIEARVLFHRLENVAGCETDVLKGSRPTATGIPDPPVLYVAGDYSLGGEGGAEMPNMRQFIDRLPETTVDNKEHRERSLTLRKSKLSELIWVSAIRSPYIEKRWGPVQNAQGYSVEQELIIYLHLSNRSSPILHQRTCRLP